MRIAVVGAGVSGLVAAHLLHRDHDVTVFEAAPGVGGHVHTVRVDVDGGTHDVDTGFIVYNERNYPHFTRLLADLGVATKPSSMSFSVREDHGSFEFSSAIPFGVLARPAQAFDPGFQRMLADLFRFRRAARRFLRTAAADDARTVAEFVTARRCSPQFVDRLLVPLGASIWSADRSRFLAFPARYVFAFLDNHGLLSTADRPRWRTVDGGAARYVEALTRPFRHRIRTRARVASVTRDVAGVEVRTQGGHPERFDHVVLATHGDDTLRILGDATSREREVLQAFPYQRNHAVLHTDRSLLPRSRRAWASWNYHLGRDPEQPVGVTYHMNRLQGIDTPTQVCVTLNRDELIDPALVIERIEYAHPLYTSRSPRAQSMVHTIDGVNRTSFCGAYWGHGFHEDGVVSAMRAVAGIGGARSLGAAA